jgi:uncharacterized Zn-finger protein
MSKHSEQQGKAACTQQSVLITEADLPLSCPPKKMRIWDAHPRVYLSLDLDGKTICPYCSTTYFMTKIKTEEVR